MVSNRIKEFIKQRNYTLKDAAEAVGLSETGFWKALKKNDFKLSTLKELSKLLDIPVGVLIDDQTIAKKEFQNRSNEMLDLQTRLGNSVNIGTINSLIEIVTSNAISGKGLGYLGYNNIYQDFEVAFFDLKDKIDKKELSRIREVFYINGQEMRQSDDIYKNRILIYNKDKK
jgi:transcriptional regulator with XRE-family HTH domain